MTVSRAGSDRSAARPPSLKGGRRQGATGRVALTPASDQGRDECAQPASRDARRQPVRRGKPGRTPGVRTRPFLAAVLPGSRRRLVKLTRPVRPGRMRLRLRSSSCAARRASELNLTELAGRRAVAGVAESGRRGQRRRTSARIGPPGAASTTAASTGGRPDTSAATAPVPRRTRSVAATAWLRPAWRQNGPQALIRPLAGASVEATSTRCSAAAWLQRSSGPSDHGRHPAGLDSP